MRLVSGAEFDDFMRHLFLEPKTHSGPVLYSLPDRCVMHPPCDVTLGRYALTRARTKLLEVAAWNIAAESRSQFLSPGHTCCCSRSVTLTGCHLVGVTHKTYGSPGFRIQ